MKHVKHFLIGVAFSSVAVASVTLGVFALLNAVAFFDKEGVPPGLVLVALSILFVAGKFAWDVRGED